MMRCLGNKLTKTTPTRGYSMELGAAITVLLASRLGLPVSTTQCITGAIVGVALTNGDYKSLNWKQFGKIFLGWCLTVPAAGLVSGLLMGMALNVPHWVVEEGGRMELSVLEGMGRDEMVWMIPYGNFWFEMS